MKDRTERIREIVWQHRDAATDASSSPREHIFFGMILGMRVQESDPDLAREIYDATLVGAHDRIVSVVDQLSAAWRDQM